MTPEWKKKQDALRLTNLSGMFGVEKPVRRQCADVAQDHPPGYAEADPAAVSRRLSASSSR